MLALPESLVSRVQAVFDPAAGPSARPPGPVLAGGLAAYLAVALVLAGPAGALALAPAALAAALAVVLRRRERELVVARSLVARPEEGSGAAEQRAGEPAVLARSMGVIGNGDRNLVAHEARDRRAAGDERDQAELERLISIATHDLREPLRAINGFSEMLERESSAQLSDRGQEFLRLIRQAGARMEDLVDGLGRYGRAGRPSASGPADVDLEQMLVQVTEQLRDRIAARGAQVTHDALPVVRADPAGVQEILRELIDNAVKFNDRRVPHVHVSASETADGWELTVLDDGVGIPEVERDRVFEMFRRLHPRDRFAGHGVGLAVVRRVVQRLGGRVWAEEGAGRGCAFRVVIPSLGTP